MSVGAEAGSADWDRVAAGWERGRALLWEATRGVSEWLVERLAPAPGETVLELAAGTGETGLLAAARLGPDGKLIASDRSASMVEATRRAATELGCSNVELRVLDSERIDLPDASVDGVLSRFGYILKGSPPPALSEIKRVLRPGGRVAFAVWAPRERNAWMTVPSDVMVELGYLLPQTPEEQSLSASRTPESIKGLLERAGLRPTEIEEMEVHYRFADAAELWLFVSELRGPLSLAIERLDAEERARVRAAVEERSPRIGAGFELSGISVNVAAR